MPKSYLEQYIEEIHRHPDNFNIKIHKAFEGIIEPIVKGQSDKYYFDPTPAQKFIRVCSGDIENQEQLNSLLKEAHGVDNYEKIRYIEKVMHVKCGLIRQSNSTWAGLPLILMPYQKAFEEAVEGIRVKETGKRRFTRAYLEIPKKNGKTEWKAAKAVYRLAFSTGLTILCTASQLDQAMELFNSAVHMVKSSPVLRTKLDTKGQPKPDIHFINKKGSTNINTGTFRPLPKATQSQDGKKPDYVIIDECHTVPTETYDLLLQGMLAVSADPFMELITTQGKIHPSLNDFLYELGTDILEGKSFVEDMLPVIYEIDPDDDWKKPTVWIKCNPGLGISKQYDGLKQLVDEAISNPIRLPDLLTKQFNVPGVESESVWLTADEVNQPIKYSEEEWKQKFETKGNTCWGGFDMSATGDMTAAGTLRVDKEKNILVWDCQFWITKKFLQSEIAKSSTVPWDTWIRLGYVHVSSDPYAIVDTDVSDFFKDQALHHKAVYDKIAYDPWRAEGVTRVLSNYYSRDLVLKSIKQGFNKELDAGIKYLKVLLDSKRITYNDNPVMKWCLFNTAVIEDKGGNLKLDKSAGRKKNKIDGAAALVDALAAFVPLKDKYLKPIIEDNSH